jgi:hypothetical protein
VPARIFLHLAKPARSHGFNNSMLATLPTFPTLSASQKNEIPTLLYTKLSN